MRLTQTLRDMIHANIMADIPQVSLLPEAEKLMEDQYIPTLPEAVQKAWKSNEARVFLTIASFKIMDGTLSVRIPHTDNYISTFTSSNLLDNPTLAAFTALDKQQFAENQKRNALGQQLMANLKGCQTVKQFTERFPELAQYAPKEPTQTAKLPATTNLMDSLKAAGLAMKMAA